MYVKSCPKIYNQIFDDESEAIIAGIIKKAVSKRIKPLQIKVEDPVQKTLNFEFRTAYNFRIVILRTVVDDAMNKLHCGFRLDIGQGMADKTTKDIVNLATQDGYKLLIPYNYTYPAGKEYRGSPSLYEESGEISAYVICENAPAADFDRNLAELVITTYIQTVEDRKGHVFQVSTEPFNYYRPYPYS